ncbi:magnesium transporter [Anaerobranca gottschalkii]|uniref:Magnesium transporter MgtE n=1 Tax=Anaerobranca gottschalkii DSM 13577 TaxID=1120990 RepID=A0A1I0C7Z8_9FIRM|nr:magnesium transporter [Anaerobranca gottschalkii]SET15485.1 magnesium transporter [Anaerobranca gottschalkii DSM 13577]
MEKIKETIWTHLKNKDVEALKKFLEEREVIEILDVLGELAPEEKVIIYRLLSKDKALLVFEQLDSNLQLELLKSFTEEKSIELINDLEPDDRVRLFDELPAKVTKKLLSLLTPEEREKTNLLMGFEPKTAGRIMTTEYVRLKKDWTVEEALKYIREREGLKEGIYTLYVTDDNRKLEGVLSLRELVLALPEQKIEEVMHKKVIKVRTDVDQEDVAKKIQELDLLTIPVVDREDRLVGIITIDDAMDILQEETTEDIFHKAGLLSLNKKESDRSSRLINGSVWQIWMTRLPFLILTAIGGLLAGFVIDVFEETLEAIAAVAIFIPVIMDMGGNAGTQSSTIFARALVLGHIDIKKFRRHLLKEIFIGLSMGAIVGIFTGIVASVWQGIPQLGLVVGLALGLTMTLATTLGFLIPYLLFKMNVDQAAGADPIITTIKDITGLFIYFVLVNQFLAHLM